MKRIYSFVIGVCLMISCSKNSVEQEQDLCKDAKSVPQITAVKLSNIYSLKQSVLGYLYKQDSIAVTFKYKDIEADIGTTANLILANPLVNTDGSRMSGYVNIFKKNVDNTFTKLVLKESYDFIILPVPTQAGLVVIGSNYPLRVVSLSSCSGEITYSMMFELDILNYVGGLKLNDKIKFQIYIKDRAGHISNTIETSETTLSENP